MPREEEDGGGQGAGQGQGAGEACGLAGGGPLRGGEPGWRRRLPQRHPHAGRRHAIGDLGDADLGAAPPGSPPRRGSCQAAAAGKKTRNKKTHDEFGDAAVNVPQQGHNTKHKYTLQRLILAAPRGAPLCEWSRKPTSVIVTTNNPTWTRTTLAGAASAIPAMSRSSALSSSREHGRKGAFVAFGMNTEAFYRNMVRRGAWALLRGGRGRRVGGRGGGRGV